MMDTKYFHCTCFIPTHYIRITRDDELGLVYMGYVLDQWLPWWRRIWLALEYVLLRKGTCASGEIVLTSADIDELIEMLSLKGDA